MPTTRGDKGERGPRGGRGVRGERGPVGPAATRSQILAAVQAEFDHLKTQFQIQIERTAQMRMQLNAIHNLLKQALKGSSDA